MPTEHTPCIRCGIKFRYRLTQRCVGGRRHCWITYRRPSLTQINVTIDERNALRGRIDEAYGWVEAEIAHWQRVRDSEETGLPTWKAAVIYLDVLQAVKQRMELGKRRSRKGAVAEAVVA